MSSQKNIEIELLTLYNKIAFHQINSTTTNLFEPEVFKNPLDIVYFFDEIEKLYNVVFLSSDFILDEISNISNISVKINKMLEKQNF